MKRYKIVRERSVGYGYRMPVEVVAYRATKRGARRLVELLNSQTTKPMFFYERVDRCAPKY